MGFAALRVPIKRQNGAIELLSEGYDQESGILTVSTPASDYVNESLCLDARDASAYFRGLFSEVCFFPDDQERGISVVVAAMLTLFCRMLFGPKVQRPAFVYTANAEGAGKTLLAKFAIIPQLEFCPTGTVPDKEEEFRKRIFATALVDSPVLFLDNVKGYLSNGSLEAFLTSSVVSDRVLGESRLATSRKAGWVPIFWGAVQILALPKEGTCRLDHGAQGLCINTWAFIKTGCKLSSLVGFFVSAYFFDQIRIKDIEHGGPFGIGMVNDVDAERANPTKFAMGYIVDLALFVKDPEGIKFFGVNQGLDWLGAHGFSPEHTTRSPRS